MKKKIKTKIKILTSKFISIISVLTFLPTFVFAVEQNACDVAKTGLGGILCKVNDLLGSILPILIAIGVLYFIWGVVQYFIRDSEEAKKAGKDRIIYGIIGLAIIISVWGLVNILAVTFGVDSKTLGTQLSAPADQINNLVSKPGDSSGCPELGDGSKLSDYFNYFTCIIASSIIPFIFALAMVTFIWGVVKFFIIDADEEAKRAQGKQFMIWGIIALAVMISVWGLVNILGTTFGLKTNVLPTVQPFKP